MSKLGLKEIDTDVLVIGGGSAGPYAALHLASSGVKVTLATKGVIAKSGCSTKVVYYMHPGNFIPPDSEELAVRGWNEAFSCYLADQELLVKISKLNKEIVPELERLGIFWRRNPDGKLTIGATGYANKDGKFRLRNLLASKYGETGIAIAELLRNHLMLSKARILEEIVATSILVRNGRAQGAVLLDYVNGSLLVVKAKAVILAMGTGGGYIWAYSTSPREMTADGLALAYRAGAELAGIEMQLWHIAELAAPPPWDRSLYIYPFAIPPTMEVPYLVDSNGKRFMPELEDATMWKQCNALYERLFKKGLATKNGGYYADLRHMDPQNLEEYNLQPKFLRKIGKDIRKDLVEVRMSVHTMLGGVRINTATETNIRGLYAIGTTAAMFQPTLHASLATARIAVEEAKRYIESQDQLDVTNEMIETERTRVEGFLKIGTGIRPAQIKTHIRQVMNEKMDYVKNESKMKEALNELGRIRSDQLPKMTLSSNTTRFNYDLVEALDAVNMLEMAELIVKASQIRKESRGPFQREDYPKTDDENWLRNIVVRKTETDTEFRTVPVELPYFRPMKQVAQ